MKHKLVRTLLVLGLAVAGWLWNGEMWPTSKGFMATVAEAIVGRPATPVSYAGVAPVNLGGPVNRVGVR
jgi:hypothetical protein